MSGTCADGFCCDSTCDGACASCAISGAEGICTPHPSGTDPEAECAPGVCGGATQCVYGLHRWSVALDYAPPSGALGLAGAVDKGGRTYLSISDTDGARVSLSTANGNELWSRNHPSVALGGVDTFQNGDMAIVGRSRLGATDISFGGSVGLLTGQMFIARVNDRGEGIVGYGYGVSGTPIAGGGFNHVAVDEADEIAVGGGIVGETTLGTTPLLASGSQSLWARYDGSVEHVSSALIQEGSGNDNALLLAIASNSNGDVAMFGTIAGTLILGTHTISSTDDLDFFVAVLAPNNSFRWAQTIPAGLSPAIGATGHVDITDQGDVLVSGAFPDSVEPFPGESKTSAGGDDIFVARYRPNGDGLWSRAYGGLGDDRALAAFDAAGDIVIVGEVADAIDLGGGTLTTQDVDVLIAKLDGSGNHRWSELHGDAGEQRAWLVGTTESDDIVITGINEGTLNFGGDDLVANGRQVFLARLGP